MFYQLGPTSIKAQTLDFVHLHSLRVGALVAQGHIHLDRRVKAPLAQSTTLAAAHWDGYEEHSVCVCVVVFSLHAPGFKDFLKSGCGTTSHHLSHFISSRHRNPAWMNWRRDEPALSVSMHFNKLTWIRPRSIHFLYLAFNPPLTLGFWLSRG